MSRDKKGCLDTKSETEKLSRDKKSCLETMSEAKKLSQDNAFVSDLVLRQHVCPSRDNQNDQRQQKRQPTAVDPAEGKLRKITTQLRRDRPEHRHLGAEKLTPTPTPLTGHQVSPGCQTARSDGCHMAHSDGAIWHPPL